MKALSSEELLIGDWSYDTTIIPKANQQKENYPPPPSWGRPEEFEFLEKGVCSYKKGFFERGYNAIDSTPYSKYLGTKTKYKLLNNKLLIFNLNDSIFRELMIKKITKDSLVFIDADKELTIYKKQYFKSDVNEHYDQIIVSSSGCYGTCAINNTLIDKNGRAEFNNGMYNQQNGYFISRLSKQQYSEIENNFKKSNIKSLKTDYSLMATDGNTVTVTFIVNGKIYKTIRDYFKSAPSNFIQAYEPVVYLNQSVQLHRTVLGPEFDLSVIYGFIYKNQEIFLEDSEGFYLQTELIKSKKSDFRFKPLYELHFYKYVGNKESKNIKKIETDGRYYCFNFANGNKTTYDLGYNFIQRNNLNKK